MTRPELERHVAKVHPMSEGVHAIMTAVDKHVAARIADSQCYAWVEFEKQKPESDATYFVNDGEVVSTAEWYNGAWLPRFGEVPHVWCWMPVPPFA